MSDYVIRFNTAPSRIFEDILVESDVYLYRFDIMTLECTCIDKVEIRSPKYSEHLQAFYRINNRKRTLTVPQIEGRVMILGGFLRFWLREKDDTKARDIIRAAITEDSNQHIDQLKQQIEKYENRLRKISDIQIS